MNKIELEERVKRLEHLREDFIDCLGYEKDINERITFAINELIKDFEKGVLNE